MKDKRDRYVDESQETEPFMRDLSESKDKNRVITSYFGKGMFTQIDKYFRAE